MREIRVAQAALLQRGVSLADMRGMTLPQMQSYLGIFYPRKGGATTYRSLRHKRRRKGNHE